MGQFSAVHSLWLLQHPTTLLVLPPLYISLDDGLCVVNSFSNWVPGMTQCSKLQVPGAMSDLEAGRLVSTHTCHSDFRSAGSPLTGCVILGEPISNHQLPISQNEGSGYFVGFTKAGGDITRAETQERLVSLRLYLFFFLLL